MLYARLMRHLHDRHGADGYASATAAIQGVVFVSSETVCPTSHDAVV